MLNINEVLPHSHTIVILSKIHNLPKLLTEQCIMETSKTHNISIKEAVNIIMEYSRMEIKVEFSPRIAGPVVYNDNSLQIAKKVTKDYRKNIDLNTILRDYYGKFQNQRWLINKNTTFKQYEKFIKMIRENITKVDYYLDIGCGDGHALTVIAEAINAQHAICCDVEDVRTVDSNFTLIRIDEPLKFDDASIDVISVFHTIHHMVDAIFRLRDIARVLKVGGLLLVKDHDVTTNIDAQNVSFEHYVYSVGEGKAQSTNKDRQEYGNIEPMYFYSEVQVTKFIESLGFVKILTDKYNNLTKVYNTIYKKIEIF